LPASPPSVAACYAEHYAGRLSLHDVHGRATFAAALLRAGIALSAIHRAVPGAA
jgi:hypothetical protein